AWSRISTAPAEGVEPDSASVDKLVQAGRAAADFQAARASLEAQRQQAAQFTQEQDELRFQISQLKGRLAALNDDSEFEVGVLREEVARLDARVEAVVEHLVAAAEPVVEHFKSIPGIRESVIGHAPAHDLRPPS